MAKTVTRQTLLQFGSSGSSANFGQFGSQAAGSPVTTKSIPTMQSLAAWLSGLQSAVAAGNAPYLQDMNTLFYVLAYQQFYTLQEGVPEYDSGTTYYIASIVKRPGAPEYYASLTDANVGNALPTAGASNTNWQFLSGIISSSFRVGGPLAMNAQKVTGLANGTALTDAAAFGQIPWIQRVQSTYTTSFSTSNVAYQATGHTVAITPTVNTNKIRLTITGVAQASGSGAAIYTVYCNGSDILTGTANGFGRVTPAGGTLSLEAQTALSYVHAPASTSLQTYEVRLKSGGGTVQWGDATTILIAEEILP